MSARVTRESAAGRAYLDLRRLARADGRATEEYLRLYALEGFLARLAASPNRDQFVVKGSVLLAAYDARRPTADIDLAGLVTSNEVEAVRSLSLLSLPQAPRPRTAWCSTPPLLLPRSARKDEYSGVRVSLTASLATARLALHVDVNVGDPVRPGPQDVAIPRLLGGEIAMLGYPIVRVLAEKLVTAAQRGMANTRWRDFADIYSLNTPDCRWRCPRGHPCGVNAPRGREPIATREPRHLRADRADAMDGLAGTTGPRRPTGSAVRRGRRARPALRRWMLPRIRTRNDMVTLR